MKWFFWLCAVSFVGSAAAWSLPGSVKPYHISRWLDDYDDGLIEHTSEIGFGDSGLVKVKFFAEYYGGIPGALDRVRKEWLQKSNSMEHWPVDSSKLQYNTWGPTQFSQPDLVHVMQLGTVYLFPYSLVSLFSGMMLLIGIAIYLRRRYRVGTLLAKNDG